MTKGPESVPDLLAALQASVDRAKADRPVTARRASPATWADRYLTAKREGSHTEATHIYADAIHDLTYQDARTFTELIKEKK